MATNAPCNGHCPFHELPQKKQKHNKLTPTQTDHYRYDRKNVSDLQINLTRCPLYKPLNYKSSLL